MFLRKPPSRRRLSDKRRRRSKLWLESLESRRLLASLVVTTTEDALDLNPGDGICEIAGGGCSLRAAIQEANELGDANGSHQVSLPAGNFVLTIEGTDETRARSGDLNIRTSLEIIGAGAAESIVDGGGLDRVIDVVLGNVTIRAVTIRGGVVDADEEAFEYIGGGIRNQDQLTLIDSLVTGNTSGSGAGVANYGGTLRIERSVITGNGSPATTRGGGVFNYANYDTANLEIIESTISDNEARTGGGVMNFGYDGVGNAVIQRSTISGNSAFTGGGVANRSKIIYEVSALANLSIRGSTITGNTAEASGGGIQSQGEYGGAAQADISNTTITGNVATGLDGGGIQSVDTFEVDTLIRSTIVSGNFAGRDGNDLWGSSISGSFNLIGDDAGHSLVSGLDNNLVGMDPRLGPLSDNGGPTLTHSLQDGSPAIDQGFNPLSLANDQRGSAFTRSVDFPAIGNASDGTDIGAIEMGQIASSFDFGDAPDGVLIGSQLRSYPTLASNNGARHRIDSLGPFLGSIRPDAEIDGGASSGANGDDLIGDDDEDSLPAGPIKLTPGQLMTGVIIAHDGAASGGFLNVWLDVNLDGDWDDAGEQLIVDRSVSAGAGNTSLAGIRLPAGAAEGTSFLRTRISTQAGLTPRGEAPDGEVEDVQVLIGNTPVPTADLSLRHVVDNRNPTIGEMVTFTITLINKGPDPATNVEVTNLLPDGLFFEQATVSRGTYEFEETWFVELLEPGSVAELTIRASVDSSDSMSHTAEITASDQADPNSTPANGISGEDDQATVTLGTCLSGGPLHVGLNRFTFSCASPGAWVGFVHGNERGPKAFAQYNVTVDIADAEGVAIAIADMQGIASVPIMITQEQLDRSVALSGDPLLVQAFEMLPRRTKGNTLAINTEAEMLLAQRIGPGAEPLEASVIQAATAGAFESWSQLPIPDEFRERLANARIVITDLPNDVLARVIGNTIVLDADAAGNGWYVDPTPWDDREFVGTPSMSRLNAVDPTAAQRIDLVTTLMHEFGHLLGLPDASGPDNIMNRDLDIGVRRMPASNTNVRNALDVNHDNQVSALDALQIINWLSRPPASLESIGSFWLDDGSLDPPFWTPMGIIESPLWTC